MPLNCRGMPSLQLIEKSELKILNVIKKAASLLQRDLLASIIDGSNYLDDAIKNRCARHHFLARSIRFALRNRYQFLIVCWQLF